MQQVVEENAFYFWHHAQLAQISPKILGMQQKAAAYNQESLAGSFQSLEERRVLSFPSDEARSCLINTILITTIYWLPYSNLANDGNRPFLEQLWSGILPYLTDQGLQDYRALVFEQPGLAREASCVAGEASVGAHHAMAGDDNGKRVVSHSSAHREC